MLSNLSNVLEASEETAHKYATMTEEAQAQATETRNLLREVEEELTARAKQLADIQEASLRNAAGLRAAHGSVSGDVPESLPGVLLENIT